MPRGSRFHPILFATLLCGALVLGPRPARAIGIADFAMTQLQVSIVVTLVLAQLGPSPSDVFATLSGTAVTTDDSISAELSGSVLGQSLSVALGGGGTGGNLSIGGSGTYGTDPVSYAALLQELQSAVYEIPSEFVQVGSSTTTFMLEDQSVSLSTTSSTDWPNDRRIVSSRERRSSRPESSR